MRVLCIRNVPDEVADDLAVLAAAAGMSTGAYALRELTKAVRRAGNLRLLETLPELDIGLDEVVEAVRSGRR